jgi:hypothetical protein
LIFDNGFSGAKRCLNTWLECELTEKEESWVEASFGFHLFLRLEKRKGGPSF